MIGTPRQWMWLVLFGVLTACAATPPSGAHEGNEPEEVVSFDEACAEEGSLLALCDSVQCGVYSCREVVERLTAGQAVLARNGGAALRSPGGSAQRYWGSAQGLPKDPQPVFIIPWGPRPPPQLLPSQKLQLAELEAERRKPHEKHHIFPQEKGLKEWFTLKGINVHEYTLLLELGKHRSIHQAPPQGGKWNEAWRQFKKDHEGRDHEARGTAHLRVRAVRCRHPLLAPADPAAAPRRPLRSMRYYLVDEVKVRRYSGSYNAAHRWFLPGVHCPQCDATWGGLSDAYPSVDLSSLPEQAKYKARLEKDYAEFERLREQVRPRIPAGVPLWPGTEFGPLVGMAQGEFGPFLMHYPWALLVRREALERLQAEGVRGLKGCCTELRFRKKNPPELLELELLPLGRVHADCLPADRPPPCTKCGRRGWKRPGEPILDAASLPREVDVFRSCDFMTMVIASERFVETARRLGYEQDILFRELPLRST